MQTDEWAPVKRYFREFSSKDRDILNKVRDFVHPKVVVSSPNTNETKDAIKKSVKPTVDSKDVEERRLSALALKETANEFYRKRNFTKAKELYTLALEIDPNSAPVYYNRAGCYIHFKDFDAAILDCSAAVGLEKNYEKAFLRRATALKKAKRFKEALLDSKHVLETINPESSSAKKMVAEIREMIKQAESPLRIEDNQSKKAVSTETTSLQALKKVENIDFQSAVAFFERPESYSGFENRWRELKGSDKAKWEFLEGYFPEMEETFINFMNSNLEVELFSEILSLLSQQLKESEYILRVESIANVFKKITKLEEIHMFMEERELEIMKNLKIISP